MASVPPSPLPSGETPLPSPVASALPSLPVPATPVIPTPIAPLPLPSPEPRPAPAAKEAEEPPLPPIKHDWPAAVMSYLIPGLGQVYQGRISKGLLFFFGLYVLFFYGMWMGEWQNVWLPDRNVRLNAVDIYKLPGFELGGWELGNLPTSLYHRPQFLGQFWIGLAAWPALEQYAEFDPTKDQGSVFGGFQRTPTEETLNELQHKGNKRWDLGWVYTVIAGVLNLLVIYDALAGPMFREPPPGWNDEHPPEPQGGG